MSEAIMKELVSGILKAAEEKIIEIILYGSTARGTNDKDSDIDIALLTKDTLTAKELDSLSDFIVDMNLKYDRVFSVIDVPNKQYQVWKDLVPCYKNVTLEGIRLWKAA